MSPLDRESIQKRMSKLQSVISKLDDCAGVSQKKFVADSMLQDIDLKEVYRNFKKAPDVFQKFADCYIKFLDKH